MLSNTTIAGMRRLQQQALMDECELLQYQAGGKSRYNVPAEAWATPVTVPCIFRPNRADEVMGETEVPRLDGSLGLAVDVESDYDVALSNLGRIRLTKLHGEAISPQLYDIAGEIKRDSVMIVVPLKRVTDE
jgi:hypothetical protein